jgi:glucan 1,3-beta-glucosidase
MYGTAVEHHALYQYQFRGGGAVFAGHIQTESPYYQPNPPAPAPFPPASGWGDPTAFGAGPQSAWGLRVVGAPNVHVYGAGLYSFFVNNNVTCAQIGNGEACQPRVLSVENTTGFGLYSLNTVGVTNLLTVNAEDKGAYSNTTDGFVDSIALFTA